MGSYIIRRLLGAIPTLFFTSILIYGILLAAPGGPEARFLANPKITPEQIEAMRKKWGLDQPVPIQYCRWLGVCNPERPGTRHLHQRPGAAELPARGHRRR